ncbi:hypothetical protein JXQ31_00580 [candidate division KSB1 bacterium]|nr:hypothetical protein [candidate division KSB1 bacterium]
MLRIFIRKSGAGWLTFLITFLSMILSLCLTVFVLYLFGHMENLPYAIFISVTVPCCLVPLLSYQFFKLLERYDKSEVEREKLISELQKASEKVNTLKSLLPICASCKKIRDDMGYWHQVEDFVRKHSNLEFSHGICPDCAKALYPDFYLKQKACE